MARGHTLIDGCSIGEGQLIKWIFKTFRAVVACGPLRSGLGLELSNYYQLLQSPLGSIWCWSNDLLDIRSPLSVALPPHGGCELIYWQCSVRCLHTLARALTPTLSWSSLPNVCRLLLLFSAKGSEYRGWEDDNVVSSLYCRSMRFNPPAAVDTLSWQMNTQPPALLYLLDETASVWSETRRVIHFYLLFTIRSSRSGNLREVAMKRMVGKALTILCRWVYLIGFNLQIKEIQFV